MPGVRVSLQRSLGKMGVRDSLSAFLRINQPTGFDCPGCAWPEADATDRKRAEFCEQGVKAVAEEMLDEVIDDRFWSANSIDALRGQSRWWLGQQGRLVSPLIKHTGRGHFEPISWPQALDRIAERVRAAAPDRTAFYTSGRTSNEAAFLFQLMVRGFGTNNLPDCSNMCHEPTSVALGEAIGMGKGTVQLDDFAKADLIVIVGQNPGSNHPRMLSTLENAKQQGARIVAVNPLPEAGLLRFKNPQTPSGLLAGGTQLSDLHLPLRPGTDLALFRYVAHRVLTDPRFEAATDHQFIERFTSGYDEWRSDVVNSDPVLLLESTGLSREDAESFLTMWAASKRIILCWAMGITQHTNSVDTVHELVNVMLLGGHIGRPGAGLCPVRGHSNVQGDRTMGIWDKPPEQFLKSLGEYFGFQAPSDPGLDVVATVAALLAGQLDVLVGLGGNFVDAVPDTGRVEAAMARVGLNVQIATKLNRSHLFGDETILLPVLSRMERDEYNGEPQSVTVEDSMSRVHASTGYAPPKSPKLRSETSVIADLAARVLDGRPNTPAVDWFECGKDNRIIRAHISSVIDGFDDFEDRIRGDGFTLDHPARRREFATKTNRARFMLSAGSNPSGFDHDATNEFVLQTMRSHDQYNTTIYGFDDRYRGLHGDRWIVLMNPTDIARLGLAVDGLVDLESRSESGSRWMRSMRVVEYPTPLGCVGAYYPEANVLIPVTHHDPKSGTPGSKSLPVLVHDVSGNRVAIEDPFHS